MNKIILTLGILLVPLYAVKAQSGICLGGFTEEFSVSSDFKDPQNPADYIDPHQLGGLYWWFYKRDPSFYIPSMNTPNKTLDVNLNIKANRYEPINISFGLLPGTNTKRTMDLSKNFDYELVIKNTGTSKIIVRFGANDVNGNQISLNGHPTSANAWAATIQMVIPPGETATLNHTTPNGNGLTNLGTFLGCSGVAWNNGIATVLTNFDYTKVTGVDMIVIDGANNPPKNLKGSIQIQKVRVGDVSCLDIVSGADHASVDVPSGICYPNPVTNGMIYFNESVSFVQIFDMRGHLVKSVFNVDDMDISTLSQGMYLVKTPKGVTKFCVSQ